MSVLAVSCLCLLLCGVRWLWGTEPKGKIMIAIQWMLLAVVLGVVCRESVQSWPQGAHPVVGLMLLALAAWSAFKGTSACARVGTVLFWFVLVLYLILLGAGVKDVKLSWLRPGLGEVNGVGCVLLLTPAAASIHLYKRKENIKPRLLLIGIFCTVAAAVTSGVLSPHMASKIQNPFYEMTRSLNLLGQARRFEAVLSAAMTVGWFCLQSVFLSLCANLADNLRPGLGRWGILGAIPVAAIVLLCDLHIPGAVLLVLCTVFWVFVPVITQGLGAEKKS